MSNLQIIEALCSTVEIYADIVRRLAGKLELIHALDEADRAAVQRAQAEYDKILGADAPDMEEEI